MFTYHGIIVRWLFAMFLVFAFYNQTGYSYIHWLMDAEDTRWSFKILVGTGLVTLLATFFLGTLRALGIIGILLGVTFFSAITWTLVDLGVLPELTYPLFVTITLVVTASMLAIGISWSHIRSRLSGQIDSNDITLR
jgi:hypothetical protein